MSFILPSLTLSNKSTVESAFWKALKKRLHLLRSLKECINVGAQLNMAIPEALFLLKQNKTLSIYTYVCIYVLD